MSDDDDDEGAPGEVGDDIDLSQTPNTCMCPCCSNFDVANQPTDLERSKTVHGSQQRAIQTSWYTKHPWITVCTCTYKIFCRVCCSAQCHNLITFSRHGNVAFVHGGFCNWKKALQRFITHEKSEMHREAVMKLAVKSSGIDVSAQLSKQFEVEKKNNRAMFLKLLESIRYLARQGLPFRGHHEDSISLEGNLYQLLLLQAKDCPTLGTWLKRRDYLSPQIVNEIIAICGNMVLRELLREIRDAEYFALIADEATDISHNEQMCIAVRWVDSRYTIHEAALGLVQLPDTRALTLFKVIKDVLIRCSLSISSCVGQAYDGAANMSGARNGVQALMKRECESCLYVHCFAHSLNLCVQEVTRKCDLLQNCMDFIYHLVQLIKFSPKRLNLFESVRKEIVLLDSEESLTPSLRPLCPTRWTVRHSAIDSILKNYHALMTTLQSIQLGHDEYAAKGRGLLAQMESFDTFFSLKLAYLIFSAVEQFSVNLQAKDTTIAEGVRGALLLKTHFDSMRTDADFGRFYHNILDSSSNLTEEPLLPRYRRIPRRIDEGAPPHRYSSPEERYHHAYFEAIDHVSGEISNRFEQSDVSTVCSIESLLIDSANDEEIPEIPEPVIKLFEGKVNLERLNIQLRMLPDAIKSAFFGTPVTVKKVTTARTIVDTFNQNNVIKGMLSEVDKVLRVYLTFPITSATAERAFSSLRRVKTFLRSSMTSQRLNNLFLLYVHKQYTDNLDLTLVAKEFASANTRRQNYFGKY